MRSLLTNIVAAETVDTYRSRKLLFDTLLLAAGTQTVAATVLSDDAPAAFLFMVSNWSGDVRDQMTNYEMSSNATSATPQDAVEKLLALVYLHMACHKGTQAHQKLSLSASTMLASGWANSAAEDMLARGLSTASLRVAAMLQFKLKKMEGEERDEFAIAKCRFILSKRAASGGQGGQGGEGGEGGEGGGSGRRSGSSSGGDGLQRSDGTPPKKSRLH